MLGGTREFPLCIFNTKSAVLRFVATFCCYGVHKQQVDVSITSNNELGSELELEVKQKLAQFYKRPSFRPLSVVLKVLTMQLDIHKPFNGGIGSYKVMRVVFAPF